MRLRSKACITLPSLPRPLSNSAAKEITKVSDKAITELRSLLAEIRVETKRLADLKAEAGKLEKELMYARYLGSLIGEDGEQGKAIPYETTVMGILVTTRDSAQEVKILPKSSPLLTFKSPLTFLSEGSLFWQGHPQILFHELLHLVLLQESYR